MRIILEFCDTTRENGWIATAEHSPRKDTDTGYWGKTPLEAMTQLAKGLATNIEFNKTLNEITDG